MIPEAKFIWQCTECGSKRLSARCIVYCDPNKDFEPEAGERGEEPLSFWCAECDRDVEACETTGFVGKEAR